MSSNLPNPLIYCYECKGILYTNLKIIKSENIPYKFCCEECCEKWKETNCILTCNSCNTKICDHQVKWYIGKDTTICKKCKDKT